jgi:hypothetical protein
LDVFQDLILEVGGHRVVERILDQGLDEVKAPPGIMDPELPMALGPEKGRAGREE